jgi:hypothetical protein
VLPARIELVGERRDRADAALDGVRHELGARSDLTQRTESTTARAGGASGMPSRWTGSGSSTIPGASRCHGPPSRHRSYTVDSGTPNATSVRAVITPSRDAAHSSALPGPRPRPTTRMIDETKAVVVRIGGSGWQRGPPWLQWGGFTPVGPQ